jgi:DMSO/TMAO reductase YedYZ molybdopterin-dependent catalytic subunit
MIMRLTIRLITAGVLAALLSAGSAFAQRNSLEIRGDVKNSRAWSVEDVKKQFAGEIQTVKSTGRDKEEKTSAGIPLVSLLKATELKTQETPKHYDLSFIVILEAHDGYRAYFTFAELSMGAKENPTLLVWEENGKPLPENELPFRLFTRGSDRSIYGITRITLVDGVKLAESLK